MSSGVRGFLWSAEQEESSWLISFKFCQNLWAANLICSIIFFLNTTYFSLCLLLLVRTYRLKWIYINLSIFKFVHCGDNASYYQVIYSPEFHYCSFAHRYSSICFLCIAFDCNKFIQWVRQGDVEGPSRWEQVVTRSGVFWWPQFYPWDPCICSLRAGHVTQVSPQMEEMDPMQVAGSHRSCWAPGFIWQGRNTGDLGIWENQSPCPEVSSCTLPASQPPDPSPFRGELRAQLCCKTCHTSICNDNPTSGSCSPQPSIPLFQTQKPLPKTMWLSR